MICLREAQSWGQNWNLKRDHKVGGDRALDFEVAALLESGPIALIASPAWRSTGRCQHR